MLRIKFILNNCIKRTEKVKSSLSGLPAKSIYANALALDKKIDKSKLVDFLAHHGGFEPSTPSVGGLCSIQLG